MARLSGPGRLRFIVQPTVAILLGVRSGIRDAREGVPPFLWALAFHGKHRRELFRSAFVSIRDLVAIAILLDVISQFLIFHEVRPGAALLVGPVLITLPYVVSPGIKQSDCAQESPTCVVGSHMLKRSEMKWFALVSTNPGWSESPVRQSCQLRANPAR